MPINYDIVFHNIVLIVPLKFEEIILFHRKIVLTIAALFFTVGLTGAPVLFNANTLSFESAAAFADSKKDKKEKKEKKEKKAKKEKSCTGDQPCNDDNENRKDKDKRKDGDKRKDKDKDDDKDEDKKDG